VFAEVGSSSAPPPDSWAYAKKLDEITNVVAMFDVLIVDLDKEMTQAKAEGKNRQEDYKTMMTESAARRTEDSKALGNKTSAKAYAETMLSEQSHVKKDTTQELWPTLKFIDSLHRECDWLMKFFDVWKWQELARKML